MTTQYFMEIRLAHDGDVVRYDMDPVISDDLSLEDATALGTRLFAAMEGLLDAHQNGEYPDATLVRWWLAGSDGEVFDEDTTLPTG